MKYILLLLVSLSAKINVVFFMNYDGKRCVQMGIYSVWTWRFATFVYNWSDGGLRVKNLNLQWFANIFTSCRFFLRGVQVNKYISRRCGTLHRFSECWEETRQYIPPEKNCFQISAFISKLSDKALLNWCAFALDGVKIVGYGRTRRF